MKTNYQLNMETSRDVVHIFWTGGWDSTFRVLQLLLKEKVPVQPHYIVRPEQSTGREINTINNIRRKLRNHFPEGSKLLLPVQFVDRKSIYIREEIKARFDEIKDQEKINIQYLILASYCDQKDLNNVELCILNAEVSHRKDKLIFGSFSFPLSGKTKSEIAVRSEENGWMELMKLTVFCRRPRNGKPCGLCGPCSDAVDAGIGWRLPLKSRLIAYIQLPFRKWWRDNYSKQNKGLLKYIPSLLKNRY